MDERNPGQVPPRAPITAGGVVMILLGTLLLVFPGGCSLFFLVVGWTDIFSARSHPYITSVIGFIVIGFLIAAGGVWLARAGWRRRRARPGASAS